MKLMGDVFEGDVTVFVMDMTGRVVTTQSESFRGSSDLVKLNTGDLTAGIYFVTLLSEDGKKATKKLIIQ